MNIHEPRDDSAIPELDRFTQPHPDGAGPGFEAEVFRRIDERRRRRRAVAVGTGLGLVLVLGLVALVPRFAGHRETRALAAEAERLEAQASQLESELADLRALAERPTRIYLGGSERVDLFVDLDEIVRARRGLAQSPGDRLEVQPMLLER